MRDIAIVATSMVQTLAMDTDTEVEFMVPVISDVKRQVSMEAQDFGFICSGSSDFLAGQAFSFVHTLDAVGAVPPISESHVEMDGAWALYEAWVKLQLGEVDTALIYSYGKTSPGSLRDVLATQLDPYYVTPLWPDAHSLAALAARIGLESGQFTATDMAAVAARSLRNATDNPLAVRSAKTHPNLTTAENILAEAEVVPPLRELDCAIDVDGGVAVVIAAEDEARRLCDRPVWIRGIDHRIDAQNIGARDLTRSESAAKAAAQAGMANGCFNGEKLDFIEFYAPYSYQELILLSELGLIDELGLSADGSGGANGDDFINPSGGVLAGHTMMGSGLMRLAEASQRISQGKGDRALAHATSGPLLQQNLICVLEGE